MKYPPVFQFIIAIALAWILKRFFPIWAYDSMIIPYTVAACGIAGVWFLTMALRLFRQYNTTFNPLDPSKTNTLVVTGVYRFTRNPMYVGLLLLVLAWCLWLGDVGALIVPPIFVIAMNFLQISGEEQALQQKFGDDYTVYCSQVRRWL